jgi:hypothetical protein
VALGLELRASMLAMQVFYHFSYSTSSHQTPRMIMVLKEKMFYFSNFIFRLFTVFSLAASMELSGSL